jgi:transcription initiation factor TFIIIB Brf1 subunit/transcription initiation factor TFIIB
MICNICNCTDLVLDFKKDKYDYIKCNNCGIVFQNPIIEEDVENYYKNEYYKQTRPFEQFINFFTKNKNFKIIKKIQKYKKNGTLLDIGASY